MSKDAQREAAAIGVGRSMTDDPHYWRNPGLTARQRVNAIWTHFAPTTHKYEAMMEAMEAAIEAHAPPKDPAP